MNLFCLPYSGASSAVYYQWQRKLPTWIKVCPVELPGRGMRMDEPLQTNFSELVIQLADDVSGRINGQPYAVFGHSLGAILAFELVRQLVVIGAPDPITLIASGTSAPTQRQRCIEDLEALETDDNLIAHLKKLGGMPEEVINNQELMEMILPVIRADFELCKNYSYAPSVNKFSCPLVVISGRDEDITSEELLAWQDQAGERFSMMKFEGKHFFIHESQADVLQYIRKHIRECMAAAKSGGSQVGYSSGLMLG
ncbi:thioesterase II family protein [Oceanobacter antarcticus]|uniref:Alpha/beta fold hydrolase n=1 Tax=Oceanobacter antarcticus TaxID=3133425 RepID=A0ABW8NNN5_9GAMM